MITLRFAGAWAPIIALASLLAAHQAQAAPATAYVVLGENGARIARAVTSAAECPSLVVDGRGLAMTLRAPAGTEPQRPTRSNPSQSKPSMFDASVCEAALPPTAHTASIGGQALPLPPAVIRRIVVIGDTGCRIKLADKAFQACNDPKAYPFAQVAAAAAKWKPDLVIHVGDYLYRENPCPDGMAGCAGSVWGYGLDAWRADFLEPAAPLLRAAPWAAVRGNHESCARAGQGWWRLLDARPLVVGRDCNHAADDSVGDYSDPFAIPLGKGSQLIVWDSSNAPNGPMAPQDPRFARYRDTAAKIAALAARAPHNLLADHHPMLALSASEGKSDLPRFNGGNPGLQAAFRSADANLFPASIDLLLSGHVHVWEAVGFASGYPVQIVAGFSGTQEDIVPLPAKAPDKPDIAPGAVVTALSSWVDGFGFMTLARTGPAAWTAEVHDLKGVVVAACKIDGRTLRCDKGQVHHP
ncbi:metallophosphoesterase [Phenylobacterium montanum]|uniref:Metallophosphoesterase n=1 Tax=Phenylobacterium montanum TaxID=2823693 RepID=A0A975FZR2_9CAUL|nr:metallophosphoesterase [Caulobacter sp. S6]QUD87848.1 metallophosphoesterase [Caulobacter sp. S6]